jgi:hypothetical protein
MYLDTAFGAMHIALDLVSAALAAEKIQGNVHNRKYEPLKQLQSDLRLKVLFNFQVKSYSYKWLVRYNLLAHKTQ